MMKYRYLLLFYSIFFSISCFSQERLSKKDSLLHFLSPLRQYKVTHYQLTLELFPEKKTIVANNKIQFIPLKEREKIQIDLDERLQIDSIIFEKKPISFTRLHRAVFITFPQELPKGEKKNIVVYYSGSPLEAKRPPWEGGFLWGKDDENRDWITVSCQGIGASIWWPNKDHMTSKPDSMTLIGIVPKELTLVSNGNLVSTKIYKDKKQMEWKINHPINNYNVSINVGHYKNFKNFYYSPVKKDSLELDYYVLDYNLEKAKKHFGQVKEMLSIYENILDIYPFWQDGFGMVEVNYWGMEHQGAIAYGNHYKNNETGFDFIIIHESGHEYFGNSITAKDKAQLWIHESFTTYLEALYIEKKHNYQRALSYMKKQRGRIVNTYPIIDPQYINGSYKDTDMYFKGSWMLHTIRNVVNNDKIWFSCIKNFYQKFKYQIIDNKQVIDFFSAFTKLNLKTIFLQYLKREKIPVFTYEIQKKGDRVTMNYYWEQVPKTFTMPIEILVGKKIMRIHPTTEKQKIQIPNEEVIVSTDKFYVDIQKIE